MQDKLTRLAELIEQLKPLVAEWKELSDELSIPANPVSLMPSPVVEGSDDSSSDWESSDEWAESSC